MGTFPSFLLWKFCYWFITNQLVIFKFLSIYLLLRQGLIYLKLGLNVEYGRYVGPELDLPADCGFRATTGD